MKNVNPFLRRARVILGFVVVLILIVGSPALSAKKRKPASLARKPIGIRIGPAEQVKRAFLWNANSAYSVVRDDIDERRRSNASNCDDGEVKLPDRLKSENLTVVPYAFSGIYGRECTGRSACKAEDVKTYLIVVPFTVKCDQSTVGTSLIYKMTLMKDSRTGRLSATGPWKVEIKQ